MTKILCIDDEVSLIEIFSVILRRQGINIVIAHNGSKGVEMVRSEAPDLVLLDLMMPGMDGWAVCTEVRKFSKVPIIIVSALDHPGMVVRALDAGADDYLIKPVPSGVLIAHINNLLRRAEAEQEKKLIREKKIHTQPLQIDRA